MLLPGFSSGWSQSLSGSTGRPLEWDGSCFHYSVHEDGSGDVDFDDLLEIVRASFDAWEDVPCSYFYFVETAPASVDRQEHNEGSGNVNLLVWRESPDEWPYGSAVIALTSVHHEPATGRILDVDIEMNGADFEFGTMDDYPAGTHLVDLQSTLTHEAGHSVGLDHSDDPEATMALYAQPGSTHKRTLEQDDIDGLCALYPLDADPEVCEEPHCGLDLEGDGPACEEPDETSGSDCACSVPGASGRASSFWLPAILAR